MSSDSCVHGHTSGRYKSGPCKECAALSFRRWYLNNPEKVKERSLKWAAANPGKIRKKNDKWRAKNPEKVKGYWQKYHKENPEKRRESSLKSAAKHRGRRRAACRKWRIANLPKAAAAQAARRANQFQAMPPWVDQAALEAVYQRAKNAGLTVDHIIPLKHSLVCGLHVPWNLQLLTAVENTRKGNRWKQEDALSSRIPQ